MNKGLDRQKEIERIAQEIYEAIKEAGGNIVMVDAIYLAEYLFKFQQNNIDVIRCEHLDGRLSVQFNPVKNMTEIDYEQTTRENL